MSCSVLFLDGLVGPNHNYAGLSPGNVASMQHKGLISSPRAAALQGLEKMWLLHQKGIPQAFAPPQLRPQLSLLRMLGFNGDDQHIIEQAQRETPHLLAACFSSSAMWCANAATVSASADSDDRKVQITPANLISTLHRSLEVKQNQKFLKIAFADPEFFAHHQPLPLQQSFADEGAANHIRLSDPASQQSLSLFIYDRTAEQSYIGNYPARQSKVASQALIRQHQLPEDKTMLIQQSPEAITAGAFHNDVVALGYNNLLLLHEKAFSNQAEIKKRLLQKSKHWQQPLIIHEVSEQQLSLAEAIKSYLFNSELFATEGGGLGIVCPEECQQSQHTQTVLQQLLSEQRLQEVIYLDLKQSMQNGGGPACLRLMLPLNQQERQRVNPAIMLTEQRYQQLKVWIKQHYRDQLTPSDLADPLLRTEITTALEQLQQLLEIPQLYPELTG